MSRKFREHIQKLQEQKGIDDQYIAEYLGVPLQKYKQSIDGRKPFFYDDLRLLEQLFGIKAGKLVDEYMNVPAVKGTRKEPIEDREAVDDELSIDDKTVDEEEQKVMEETDDLLQEESGGPTPRIEIKRPKIKKNEEIIYKFKRKKRDKQVSNFGSQEEIITLTSIRIPKYYDPTNEKEVRTALGRTLKQCRDIRKMGIEYVAERMLVDKNTWRSYERGTCFPARVTPRQMSELFNADKNIFAQFYKEMDEIHNNRRQERMKEKVEHAAAISWHTIEVFLENKGSVEQTAKRLLVDRSLIQKRLAKIFEQEPELEYIIYDSLPEDAGIKKKGTFENANRRKLFEVIQQQYKPNMTGQEKIILAETAGYRSWFSLQRAVEGRGLTFEQILREKIPEKPFKEYSCAWPREEKEYKKS